MSAHRNPPAKGALPRGGQGAAGAGFRPDPEPGSPMARWLVWRASWTRTVDDWLRDGRPDFLVVEADKVFP